MQLSYTLSEATARDAGIPSQNSQIVHPANPTLGVLEEGFPTLTLPGIRTLASEEESENNGSLELGLLFDGFDELSPFAADLDCGTNLSMVGLGIFLGIRELEDGGEDIECTQHYSEFTNTLELISRSSYVN